MADHLTHLNERGEVHMVDVGSKTANYRRAIATGSVQLSRTAFECLNDGRVKKGDVLATARVAGIMAAKKTADIIPLCHQLPITKIEVNIELNPIQHRAIIFAEVATTAQTGVEMEALVAVSTAALTIYDMLKAVDRSISISNIELVEKQGGESGHYRRPPRVKRRGGKLGDETSIPPKVASDPAEQTVLEPAAPIKKSKKRKNKDEARTVTAGIYAQSNTVISLPTDDPRLEALLSQDPIRSAYMLGDLDPAYAHGCSWYAPDDPSLKALLLLYSALSAPTLLSEGDVDGIESILLAAWDKLPRRLYYQVPKSHAPKLKSFFRLTKRRKMLRMGLSKSDAPPCKRDSSVEVLSHRHTGEIMSLYQHYPDNFFDPSMLNTGMYFGIREKDELVSVAGIHLLSESRDIASVGNIVTHPNHRGHGYASTCVSHLVTELLERVDKIALNVAADNKSAIRCYEGVGFKTYFEFQEGWATRHSSKPVAAEEID